MKWIKNNIIPIICCIVLVFILSNISYISTTFSNILEKKSATSLLEKNPYQKKDEFLFIQNTEDFSPLSKNDLKNIFYTIVNNGWNNFTLYCPSEYKDCIKDMKEFSKNQDLLTHINNFVHPYNSFSNIKTTMSETGEININIDYLYKEEQKQNINEKIKEISKQILNDSMTNYEKIKEIHDYIINHTKYDVSRNDVGESIYQSYIAIGPLFDGFATCNGYTDIMAIFLTELNIPNYKIATTPSSENTKEGHVWNALFLDGEWLHLDLTWDDPVSNDGKDYLQHKYFLVDNEELLKADEGDVLVIEHMFKQSIYIEFKKE